jgi:hypothetical protein
MLVGTITPDDNFAGRSTRDFGIGESIALGFRDDDGTSTPARAQQLGGLRWELVSGGGTLAAYNNNGVGTLVAPAARGTVVLRLQRLSGPANRRTVATYTLNVVPPTDAQIVRDTSAPLYHRQNTCSVGFSGLVRFSPHNVSFRGLIFREGTCQARASGFFRRFDGLVHPNGDPFEIGGGNQQTGCQLSVPDSVRMAPDLTASPPITLGPPYETGDFLWEIPWYYRVGSGSETRFAVAHQHAIAEPSGRCSIEKKGSGLVRCDAATASSDYYALRGGRRFLSAVA